MPAEGSAFENVIGDLSARFVGIEPPAVRRRGLHDALRAVVEWFGTDRASFQEFSPDLQSGDSPRTYAWTRTRCRARPSACALAALPLVFQSSSSAGRDVVGGPPACRPAARRRRRARVRGARRHARHPHAAAGRCREDPVRDFDGGLHAAPRVDADRREPAADHRRDPGQCVRSQAPRRRADRAPRRNPGAARQTAGRERVAARRSAVAARLRRNRRPEPRHPPGARAGVAGGANGCGGPAARRDRDGQGAARARPPPAQPPERPGVRAGQLRGHPRHAHRVASCSATRRARSPAPSRHAPAGSRPRTAARCSWTKLASSASTCRPSCCACCRMGRSSGWARRGPSAPMSASSPPPTETSIARWPTAGFARISTIGSTCFHSSSRRCASGARTSRCSSGRSSTGGRASSAGTSTRCPGASCARSSRTAGRATCANWRTSSSVR